VVDDKTVGPLAKKKEATKVEEPKVVPAPLSEESGESMEEQWGRVLEAVKPYNHSVEAFLRATRPKGIDGDKVVLEVYYQFHKDKLEEPKNRQIVEKGLKKVYGRELGFECELSRGKKAAYAPRQVQDKDIGGPKADGDIYEVAKEIFG